MSFKSKLAEAESHLSSYEDVASEILKAAKGGLDKLKGHRDAILASIEAAASTAEKFAKSIVTDEPEPGPSETPVIEAPTSLVTRLPAPDADPAKFLGRG